MSSRLQSYITLTKPGIVRGNAMMAAAGFLFAIDGHFDVIAALALTIGTSFVIASACVLNNVIDRDIDSKMTRTKKRAMVTKTIPIKHALTYATLLSLAGFALLAMLTNWLAILLGAIALISYVCVYTPLKRRTLHGTLVGSIPGAVPPMAGYCAATGRFDTTAVLLGLLLVTWQMPHFYSIAMFRSEDYKSASIPVLPLVRGMLATKKQIMAYIVLFMVSIASLTIFGSASYIFFVVGLCLAASWLMRGYHGFSAKDEVKWARSMFGRSLVVLTGITVLLAANSFLP